MEMDILGDLINFLLENLCGHWEEKNVPMGETILDDGIITRKTDI